MRSRSSIETILIRQISLSIPTNLILPQSISIKHNSGRRRIGLHNLLKLIDGGRSVLMIDSIADPNSPTSSTYLEKRKKEEGLCMLDIIINLNHPQSTMYPLQNKIRVSMMNPLSNS